MNLPEPTDAWLRKSSASRGAALSPVMLAAGLRAVAEELSNRRQRRSLTQLAELIQSGAEINVDALQTLGIPGDLREVILAGIETGQLPLLLENYLSVAEEQRSLWRSLLLNVTYPLVLIGFAAVICSGFLILAVPIFRELFEDFGIELPSITLFVLYFSDFLIVAWVPVLLLMLVGGLLVLLGQLTTGLLLMCQRRLPFAAWWARLMHHLPWIGSAQLMSGYSEFCARLAVLIESRLPLDSALRILSGTLHDPYLAQLAGQLADRVEAGESVEELASFSAEIPQTLAHALRWGDSEESFAAGLKSMATVFAVQARVAVRQLIVIAEPLTLISVAITVGMIVIALFYPLIGLLNALS